MVLLHHIPLATGTCLMIFKWLDKECHAFHFCTEKAKKTSSILRSQPLVILKPRHHQQCIQSSEITLAAIVAFAKSLGGIFLHSASGVNNE